LDLGRAIKVPGLGLISSQIYKDDPIVYFRLEDGFLKKCNLYFEDLDIKESKYPTVSINFSNIKKLTSVDREIMRQAIENIFSEIAQIFLEFYTGNFQLDLGMLGKFLLSDRTLRFMPFLRAKKIRVEKKTTIKNMIDMSVRRGIGAPPREEVSEEGQISVAREEGLKQSHDYKVAVDSAQRSQGMSMFGQTLISPIRRTALPPNSEERDLNLMFGAGTDPLALNQNFSMLTADSHNLINATFSRPPHARNRCPPVIDLYARTQATPVASLYNSLSASSRIGLFYSLATKYLHFNLEKNEIAYLKIEENKTKLTANEELLKDMATVEEEIKYIVDAKAHSELEPKIRSKLNCYSRYREYIDSQIPEGIVAPIRQYWITNVLDLIPGHHQDLTSGQIEAIIDNVLSEINSDYYIAVKKSILDYILKEDSEKLRVGIMQRFDPPTEYGEGKSKGVVADQGWVERTQKARTDIKHNLVNYNHATLSVIAAWVEISKDSYFNLPKSDSIKQSHFDFRQAQRASITMVQNKIKTTWITEIGKIYHKELKDMEKHEVAKFFTATNMLMSSQLRELIYRSLYELKDFISKYDKPNHLSAKECAENDKDRTKPLQKSFLIIPMTVNSDNKIRLADKPETIINDILTLIDDVVRSSENVPLPQNNIARLSEKTLYKVSVDKDEVVNEIRSYVERVLTENSKVIEKVTEIFAPYEYLLVDQNELTKILEKKPKPTLKEYEKMINKYKTISDEIEEKIPYFIYMSMAVIDCRVIKNQLYEMCKTLTKIILQDINNNLMAMNSTVSEETKKMFDCFERGTKTEGLKAEAEHYEECDKQKDLIEKKEKQRVMANFKEITEMLFFLYKYNHLVEQTNLTSINSTASNVHKIDDELRKYREQQSNLKDRIKKELDTNKDAYDDSIKNLLDKLNKIKNMDAVEHETAYARVKEMDTQLQHCETTSKEINYIQEKIGMRKTAFEDLEKTKNLINPFKDLWFLNKDVTDNLEKWEKDIKIFDLVAADVIKSARLMEGRSTEILNRFSDMEEKPKIAIDNVEFIRNKIKAFQHKAPLLTALCSKGMQERHWEEVNQYLEKHKILMRWEPTSTHKLIDCGDLVPHKEFLTEIADKSEKEYKNLQLLDSMLTAWDNVEIKLKSWKDTGSYAIVGDSVDEIQTLLDEHIIQTQSMKGSQFAKIFDERIQHWEHDLLYLRDTLELWLKVQANWIYLLPIFSSPDIKRELQKEDAEFHKVSNRWKEIMTETLSSNRAMLVPRNPTLKDTFKNMLEKLESVQEKLIGYLNMKRSNFPRFYFLSEDSLIEVLSEARDATKIQKYCKILFEGIKELNFNAEDVILGMKSSEGEYLEFGNSIPTRPLQGLVEKWLQTLEDTMVFEVRRSIEIAFADYEQMSREEFVLNRPGMTVLNIDMTEWTKDTEAAIIEGKDGLQKYSRKMASDLDKIVQLIKRKDMTPLNRCTLEALIVLDVHSQEVIRQLIEAKVTSITDFDYEAQLRYYWEMKPNAKQLDTVVKMVSTTLDYNYEYLGNSSRLVITPLTDRCYRTLCGAIGLNYGGAPEGPAGTGKTETVKDLAKALARMIVVFNCSDSLNFTSMARFFKGLCCTGGWSCLDEFNRIQLEVLSVIAQQLQCIQNAIKDGKSEFEFAGSLIRLKPTCNCFITMNPGYAGRSELPDNLKALFRSVAMMVPDYALIGEIRLYSFGFIQAQPLSKKIVTTYKLCSEQISAQKHYDYGMRAVNSVLVAAGNLRKAAPNDAEDVQILRAINEVNEAKFLSIDLPLFKAITIDLFPDTKIPEIDIKKLTECLHKVIDQRGLQSVDYFIEKIIQIYQMILVRHGLMVVGEPYGGKTSAIKVLADALALMKKTYNEEMAVEYICLNPKSITNTQLYGNTDIATGEWTDGVLPVKFKKLANDPPTERKWLWFDGPVDAIWIEDMNTVLDDNKKLCLSNGDIFYMSPVMNLIFEPMDLLVASPATVSRCGMILMEPHMLGWMHLYKSWKVPKYKFIDREVLDEMDVFIINVFTPLVRQYEKGVFELTAPCMIQNIVVTMLKLADPFINRLEEKLFADSMDLKEKRAYFDKVMTYSIVWSMGATLILDHRQKFDSVLKKLINSPDSSLEQEQAKKHRKTELPDGGSGRVFDYCLTVELQTVAEGETKVYLRWIKWAEVRSPDDKEQEVGKNEQPNEIIVPTVDLLRYTQLIKSYIDMMCHVLVCGPTGTGKTIYIKRIMKSLEEKKIYQTLEVGFSAQTTAKQVQEIIDGSLIRRSSKGIYGPPPGKKMILFVDDLSMPRKETYGAQPPIELLRQLLDKGGWYDNAEKHKPFKEIHDVIFLSAMGPPGGGRNTVTPRFQRLLALISFTSIDDSQMELIFKSILTVRFNDGNFNEEVSKMTIPLVKATLQIYTSVMNYFKPLPSKSHYLFNLRDFAKVIFGICMVDADRVKTKAMVTKLWIHEVWRVFGDRLNSEEDRLYLLNELIKKTTHKNLGENFDNLLIELDRDGNSKIETLEEMRGLIFTDVMSASSLKNRPYELVTDMDRLTRSCENALSQYDLASDKPLNIVLFNFAIEHLLIISRILKQPGANALLVGIGGSGRQSLTKLASKIADYAVFQIELSKTYGVDEWKEDLKLTLKNAGGKAENTVFLFRDSQIKMESFIEDINNLLNNGEVPNLFPPEERGEILELSRKNAKNLNREGIETADQLMALFTETVKKKLHVVLCFSPIGSNFRNKIRMFPALVNCCTIDWFFEWPQEALVSVAQKFIGETNLPAAVKEQCVDMVKFFHLDTQRWAQDFYKQLRRQYYVTPTSFIEMINQFKNLLVEKTDQVSSQQYKYSNGYTQIIEAEQSVESIKAELNKLAPFLEEATKNVTQVVEETKIKEREANEVKEVVMKEAVICEGIAEKARVISEDCKAELASVIPTIVTALEKLDKVDEKNFAMMKGASIPLPLLLTSQCLAIILSIQPDMVKNSETMKVEPDWRKTVQKMYLDVKGQIEKMKKFNNIDLSKEGEIFEKEINVIDEKQYNALNKLFKDYPTELSVPKIQTCLSACVDIFKWVQSQFELKPVEISARPKRKNYLIARKERDDASAILDIKKKQLKEKEDELAGYTRKLEQKMAEKQKLETEFANTKLKLERSNILIDNLKDEKARWKDLATKLKMELDNLVGDVLISSAVISYLGPFTSGFRAQIVEQWINKAKEMKLPGNEGAGLVSTFGDPVRIQFWQIKDLPSDNFSTENAIIVTKSRRWSLCIDPQIQANKWIKNLEGPKLIITNLASNFMRDIERAIKFGQPCLLENVGEEIDAALDPILLKQYTGTGNSMTIKLGDKTVDWNPSFFLYVTTKERNPHYLPEVSTKVTLINFMITSEGLADQLLAIIVKKEMPEKEEQKKQLIKESAENKDELRKLEDKILETLAQPKDQLLESENAIEVLTKSKKKSNEIREKQIMAEATEKDINEARQNYITISKTASCLFFAISDLGNIDPMYQYSLTYFIDLFQASIDKAERSPDIPERLGYIEAHFLYSLYLNISRSLFVKDKLLFSFLLCVRLKEFRNEINPQYYNFFLTGSVGKPKSYINPPQGSDWLTKYQWENFCKVSEFKGPFDNIHRNFEPIMAEWKRIYDSEDPLKEKFPEPYERTMNSFEKMILIKIIRPDKIVPFIQQFVIDNLGQKFVEIPAFDLEAVFNESSKTTPLIFVLTPGVDPYNMLKTFADKKGTILEGISLGQGQGEIALKKIAEASEQGFWVVLQNCHLAESFMNPLEKKCDEISLAPGKIVDNFRLWLTSYPSKTFPSSILQNGIKMTNEPPSGLKNNLKTALMIDEITNPANFNKSNNLTAYRRLVYGLCFFHSVIQERRKFGPLGWNIPYEFTESDLRISAAQLRIFINKYPEDLPLAALKYLTAECNYGGRVTDDKDRRLIKVLLEDYYNKDLATTENYELVPAYPKYIIPYFNTYNEYLTYVDSLPILTPPGIYGFHLNANITKELNETSILVETLLSCQGGGASKGGDDPNQVSALINKILEEFVQPFNLSEAREKYQPRKEESMNIILLQELERYNKLINTIRSSLSSIKDALAGLIVFSFELEETLNFIKINKIPKVWMDNSYPSLKPLPGYIENIKQRVDFFKKWIAEGKPSVYWISGFFFPQGFLTGVQQNYARKYVIAIDQLVYDFEVLPENADTSKPPENGAYIHGFFIEGCKFDYERMALAESDPKVLFVPGPKMHFKPTLISDMANSPLQDYYECPLYRTGDRRGVLMTTGHSTNFVMMIRLPSIEDQRHWVKRGVAAITQLND